MTANNHGSSADRRTYKLELVARLAGAFACLQGAYYTLRGLPEFLEMNDPWFSGLILSMSGSLLFLGILNMVLRARRRKIYGSAGAAALGAALLLIWVNGVFAIDWAVRVSFAAFVAGFLLSGMEATRVIFHLLAQKQSEKQREDNP